MVKQNLFDNFTYTKMFAYDLRLNQHNTFMLEEDLTEFFQGQNLRKVIMTENKA